MATLAPLLPSTAELQGNRTAPDECGRSGTAVLCLPCPALLCPASGAPGRGKRTQPRCPAPGWSPGRGHARLGARSHPRTAGSPLPRPALRGTRPPRCGWGRPSSAPSPRARQRSPARKKLSGSKAKAPRPADPGLRPAEPPSRPPPAPGCALLPGAAAARPLPAHQTVP